MTAHSLAMLAMAVLASTIAQAQPARFQGASVTRKGHLQFDAPLAAVFPLFTPLGERVWAKGWDPEVVYPRDRDIAEGMVFRTQDGVEHVWTVVRHDPAANVVAYNVVASGMLVRQLEVRCRPAGPSHTEVDVTDSYIGLSAQGNEFVERLTEETYAAKMAHWKEAIGGYLAGANKAK